MDSKLLEHYGDGSELDRLTQRAGLLEAARTQELLQRHLPAGCSILDVGGAGGVYAEWLSRCGHSVHLVDPVPVHVDEARRRAGEPPLFETQAGDARTLPFRNAAFDAVILLGPIYHLVDRNDRLLAMREAARVCVEGGLVCIAAISRFAPALDGVREGWIRKERSFETVQLQLASGTSGDHEPGFPSISYFHFPEELTEEAREAGLDVEVVYGIEGPAWFLPDIEERWQDDLLRERMLWLARVLESDPRGLSMSAHLLLVARARRAPA